MKAIVGSAIIGILLAEGAIFFFYTFKFGATSSVAISSYAIGALVVGVLGGILFFNESINLRIGIGLALGVISIIVLTRA